MRELEIKGRNNYHERQKTAYEELAGILLIAQESPCAGQSLPRFFDFVASAMLDAAKDSITVSIPTAPIVEEVLRLWTTATGKDEATTYAQSLLAALPKLREALTQLLPADLGRDPFLFENFDDTLRWIIRNIYVGERDFFDGLALKLAEKQFLMVFVSDELIESFSYRRKEAARLDAAHYDLTPIPGESHNQKLDANQYAGYQLSITSGTGSGQYVTVISNAATTLTFAAITTAPDSTSHFTLAKIYAVNGTVTGCKIANNTQNGLWANYCSGLTIVGNEICGNGAIGIDCVAQYLTIVGNDIHDMRTLRCTWMCWPGSNTPPKYCPVYFLE
ncbi:MAG TPA: right-handed parallel beta-helix repeat-containing protein [Candidatus Saccharimonadales bacterium]|nr:right-handed parallel beta-helix repeat-containing protein [Candidatus Saccharimonadales bacterium]